MVYFGVLVAFVLAWSIGGFVLFRWGWRKPSGRRRICQRLALLLGTLLVMHLLLDGVFGLFVSHSDGYGHTLTAKRWWKHNWKPINSLGLRDREHSEEALAGKRLVYVLGDSFVAGHGIEDISDRFGDRLGVELGGDFRTLSIAQPGWNTAIEHLALLEYAKRTSRVPQVIVLSYYLNDIDGEGKAFGRPRPTTLIRPPPWLLAPYVDNSPLGNEVYWRYYRLRGAGDTTYRDYLLGNFDHQGVWKAHTGQFDRIIGYARTVGARLIVVVFPFLKDVKGGQRYTARVAGHFEEKGVEAIDLGKILADRDPRTLVVNASDAHPSVELHHEVARLIAERLRAK